MGWWVEPQMERKTKIQKEEIVSGKNSTRVALKMT